MFFVWYLPCIDLQCLTGPNRGYHPDMGPNPRYAAPPPPGQGGEVGGSMVGGDGKPPHGHSHMGGQGGQGGPQPSRTPPSQGQAKEHREHHRDHHREPREGSKHREPRDRDQSEKQGTESQGSRKGRGKLRSSFSIAPLSHFNSWPFFILFILSVFGWNCFRS